MEAFSRHAPFYVGRWALSTAEPPGPLRKSPQQELRWSSRDSQSTLLIECRQRTTSCLSLKPHACSSSFFVTPSSLLPLSEPLLRASFPSLSLLWRIIGGFLILTTFTHTQSIASIHTFIIRLYNILWHVAETTGLVGSAVNSVRFTATETVCPVCTT